MEGFDRVALLIILVAGYILWGQRPTHDLDPRAFPVVRGGVSDPSKCLTDKCMTIVVAPWCGACHEAAPAIKSLRDHLNHRGVQCRIVVSQDRSDRLWEDARQWGPDTLVDEGNFMHPQGVPHEYVSDASGKVLRDIPGFPMGPDAEGTARVFGL